ncbi:MAG: tetratricopeptide repeat protein [Spirochaetales bacterium]|nr:tetratricopeptide repeat protein [Spirochaetales bacterium]
MKRVLPLFFLLLNFGFAYAMGAGEDINKGNSAYTEGQYKDALDYYEKSESTLPESPYVYFDKGTAYYKLGDYEKAKEAFEKAAVKTKDRKLETLANYNLGNCQFQEGQRQKDSDLKKAVESFRNSIKFYQAALDRDKDFRDAAHNIEVTRLIVKDLLDKLKKQQEQQGGENGKQKEIIEKLQKLITDQSKELDYTRKLSEEKDKKGVSAALKQNAAKVRKLQSTTRKETKALEDEMRKLLEENKQQPQPENPMEKARGHVENAHKFQGVAEKKITAKDIKEAIPNEEGARDELIKALESLAQPQDRQQEKQNEEKKDQEKQDAQAKDIIDDENQDKEERQARARARYVAPDKDW